MKKLVFAVAMILSFASAHAQKFEGVMKWSMKFEITDPKLKAQMDDVRKQAEDPATMAKVKELQDKMNDPQFKQMLDQNPQMKAQMEAAIRMMTGGGMESMMPNAILIKLKGNTSLSTIQGGLMDRVEVLHLEDKNETYAINHASKTYTKTPVNDSEKEEDAKVTKTSETRKVLNYTCTKYIIETKGDDGRPVTVNYWATNEIKDIDLKALASQQNDAQRFVYAEVDGFPLRIEATLPQGSMTMEMVEFKRGGVTAADFTLPAGYTETKTP